MGPMTRGWGLLLEGRGFIQILIVCHLFGALLARDGLVGVVGAVLWILVISDLVLGVTGVFCLDVR